jgi:hypothetical protein|tara:strand:+ start:317 stop:1261 length:945 start_codon:yes stop_codon:yes gene_type:complete
MKISIIGPGIMPIPPTGWGAVESLIWDMRNALTVLGHEVDIVNVNDPRKIIQKVNEFRPDFVHIHYDDWVGLYNYIQYPCVCTSHFGYLERPEMFGGYSNIANAFAQIKPRVFCLSEGIKKIYQVLMDIPENNLYVSPNGVDCGAFNCVDTPDYPNASIYLAKVDYRKRQHLFQSITSLWYAGNIADERFDKTKNYLGEWSKKYLYENLTHYGNLVLLSDGEAHPLVCMEAFAAGLGVVVSQWGKANLDSSKEFITIIPENKIKDIDYVEEKIKENRAYSLEHREEILNYAQKFDWINVVKKHYIPNVKMVLSE